MILMIEKGIRVSICQATYRNAKANNKYMKNYDKNIESSYIEYLYANHLYRQAMSQKLPVNGFKGVDIDCPKELFNFYKDSPFLPKRKKVKKVEKLICSIEDKCEE